MVVVDTIKSLRNWFRPNAVREKNANEILHQHPLLFLCLAVGFGSITALGELITFAVTKFVFQRKINVGLDVIWMNPLQNLIVFLLLGSILVLLSRFIPRLVTLQRTLLCFLFLNLTTWLFIPSALHRLAALVLAVGLALQMSRLLMPPLTRLLERFGLDRPSPSQGGETFSGGEISPTAEIPINRRQFLFATGVTLAGLAVGTRGWQSFQERNEISRLGPARSAAPNVILITLDTVRAASQSLYGYARQTSPQLVQMARRGVRFDMALATAPWTLPSHATIMTGQFPHKLSANWTSPLDATYPTLAEILSQHGYLTAAFVANNLNCSYETGLNRGFQHFADYAVSVEQLIMSSALSRTVANDHNLRHLSGDYRIVARKQAPEINNEFLAWHSQRDLSRPFLAFLNYMDAHDPYIHLDTFVSDQSRELYRQDPWLAPKLNWTPEEVQAQKDAYDGCLAYLDDQLGSLLSELEKRGGLENTLVIITSDHGEEFYEHHVMGHGNSLYLPALHVPLVILFPLHIPAGLGVKYPVSLRDLPATILDLLNLETASPFGGSSLKRYWQDAPHAGDWMNTVLLSELQGSSETLPPSYPVSQGDLKSLLNQQYHYIWSAAGSEELYDWQRDPWEQNNLATTANGPRILGEMRDSLAGLLTSS